MSHKATFSSRLKPASTESLINPVWSITPVPAVIIFEFICRQYFLTNLVGSTSQNIHQFKPLLINEFKVLINAAYRHNIRTRPFFVSQNSNLNACSSHKKTNRKKPEQLMKGPVINSGFSHTVSGTVLSMGQTHKRWALRVLHCTVRKWRLPVCARARGWGE